MFEALQVVEMDVWDTILVHRHIARLPGSEHALRKAW
jgi:hypothetical protein